MPADVPKKICPRCGDDEVLRSRTPWMRSLGARRCVGCRFGYFDWCGIALPRPAGFIALVVALTLPILALQPLRAQRPAPASTKKDALEVRFTPARLQRAFDGSVTYEVELRAGPRSVALDAVTLGTETVDATMLAGWFGSDRVPAMGSLRAKIHTSGAVPPHMDWAVAAKDGSRWSGFVDVAK